MNLKRKKKTQKVSFKFTIKFTLVYGYIYIRTRWTELTNSEPMDRNNITASNELLSSPMQEELYHILIESHQAYWEDVMTGGMAYVDFVTNYFGERHGLSGCNAYVKVCEMFNHHQPIIEHRFKSSAFAMDDAMDMLQEFEHVNSFFDRSLIDIQLKSIIPKLERDGVMSLLVECVNTTAMFHQQIDNESMMRVLTGMSKIDYGIYNVSHFAYFMKKMEKQALMIQHWQSMVWNLSRVVYRGRYLTQHLISSTVHNIGFLKRRPWQYDEIDECLDSVKHRLK